MLRHLIDGVAPGSMAMTRGQFKFCDGRHYEVIGSGAELSPPFNAGSSPSSVGSGAGGLSLGRDPPHPDIEQVRTSIINESEIS